MLLSEAVETVAAWRRDGKDAGLRATPPHICDAIDKLVRIGEYMTGAAREGGNLADAMQIVEEADRVRAVIRELKSAFAKSELDGGVAAAPRHPLYIAAQARLDELHDQLMMVI